MYEEREAGLILKIVMFLLPNGYPEFSVYFTLLARNIDYSNVTSHLGIMYML